MRAGNMVREREISESFRGLWCGHCLGHGLARCSAVSCGSRQRTLRQVLEYSPQSTIRNSARRLFVFLVGTTGNAVGVPLPRAFSTTCLGLTIIGWTASRSCKYEHISCALILHSAQLALSLTLLSKSVKNMWRIILFWVSVLCVVSAGADGLVLKSWQMTTAHGLPNNTVRSVFQDHSGRIWMGTQNGENERRENDLDAGTHH